MHRLTHPPAYVLLSPLVVVPVLVGVSLVGGTAPEPVIADIDATAHELAVAPERLRAVVRSSDMERFRTLDDREAAAAAWFSAHKHRFTGEPEEVAPFVGLIRLCHLDPASDPLAAEDATAVGFAITGFWCLAQAWHETGRPFGADADEIADAVARVSFYRDESVLMAVGLLSRVMVDQLSDTAPPRLLDAHRRLMSNAYVADETARKIAAWDADLERAGGATP